VVTGGSGAVTPVARRPDILQRGTSAAPEPRGRHGACGLPPRAAPPARPRAPVGRRRAGRLMLCHGRQPARQPPPAGVKVVARGQQPRPPRGAPGKRVGCGLARGPRVRSGRRSPRRLHNQRGRRAAGTPMIPRRKGAIKAARRLALFFGLASASLSYRSASRAEGRPSDDKRAVTARETEKKRRPRRPPALTAPLRRGAGRCARRAPCVVGLPPTGRQAQGR
jgi:hypothetical protein